MQHFDIDFRGLVSELSDEQLVELGLELVAETMYRESNRQAQGESQ
jgi:hypothetical protein